MDLEKFKTTLSLKYQVLEFIVLHDYETLPSNALYYKLKPLLKDYYANNEIIVVLASGGSISSDLMEHFVDLLNYLDIPDSFVKVFTDSEVIGDFFFKCGISCQKIPVSIPITDHGHKPVFNNSKTLCAYPWAGIHVWTDGSTSACCMAAGKITDRSGNPYNTKTSNLNEIFNSEYMDNLRSEFIAGRKPEVCNACWMLEDSGQESQRSLAQYRIPIVYPAISWEDKNPIRFLGGHLTSLCNLACRICSPIFSSTIATEELQQVKDPKKSPVYKILKDTTWAVRSDFFDRIAELTPELQTLEILGGEPFMMGGVLDMLERLSDQGISQHMQFNFSTNGSKYPKLFGQDFKFKRLDVTVSIDNLGKRFEYERHNGNWNQLNENLRQFIKLRDFKKGVKLVVCVTVSIQNVLYLDEIDEWIDSIGFDNRFYHLVHSPSCLSVAALTTEAKKLVCSRLSKKFDYIKNYIGKSKGSDGTEFMAYMKKLDGIRMQNFLDTHPEIAEAMGWRTAG